MKKLVIAALAATAFVATPALANTDTTTISANIAPVCALDAPADTGVNLSGATNIGNLYIVCNAAGGFLFSLSSANGFELEAAGSPTTYSYNLTSPLFPGPGQNTPISNAPVPGDAAWVAGQNIPVVVNVTGASGPAYAGNYQDTLTWTITAN